MTTDLADTLEWIAGGAGWRESVYAVVRCIPRGRVLGYGHVAALMGRAGRARQVGYALAALEPGDDVPWWRVVRSDGSVAMQGDPVRGPLQVRLLAGEGVKLGAGQRVDMRRHRWTPRG